MHGIEWKAPYPDQRSAADGKVQGAVFFDW